jgi:L-asparaginase
MVDALVQQGAQGIVVACTGNGTIHHDLLRALELASRHGVEVVRSSRCPLGRILPAAGDAIPALAGLSPVKARIALCLKLLEHRPV